MPIAHLIINGERLNVSAVRLGMRQGRHFSPLIFNVVVEDLVSTIGQEKKRNKKHTDYKVSKIISIHR